MPRVCGTFCLRLVPLVLLALACQHREVVVVTVEDPESLATEADALRVYGSSNELEVRTLDEPFPVTFAVTNPNPIQGRLTVEALVGEQVLGRAAALINFARGVGVTAVLARPCDGNRACDDGIFCNGPERCSDGVCVPGATPCVLGENQCVDAVCDEERSRCAVTVDPNLDDGELCTTDTCGTEGPVHMPLPDGTLCDWFGVKESGICAGGACSARVCDRAPDLQPCTLAPVTSPGICVGGACRASSCGDGLIDARYESCENLASSVCQGCIRQSDECTPPGPDVPCDTTLLPTAITLGDGFSCALTNDDTVWCWGRHTSGALGIGDIPPPHTLRRPFRVSSRSFQTISAGTDHVCGISNDSIWCWGDLRDHGLAMTSTPAEVPVGDATIGWERVASGDAHTCAVAGSLFVPPDPPLNYPLYCWGENSDGRLGVGDTTDRSRPTFVSGDWLDVCAGGRLTCGIRSSMNGYADQVWCFGPVAGGGLQASSTPYLLVSSNGPIAGLQCGADFVCLPQWLDQPPFTLMWRCYGDAPITTIDAEQTNFLVAGGDRVCRGALDGMVQCFDPSGSTTFMTPNGVVLPSEPPESMDVTNDHFCGFDMQSQLWCSGANSGGQLGMGHSSPVPGLEKSCCFDF